MRNENGFTLVELIVAMALGLIITAAIYNSYASQQKSQIITEKVSALQQNIRAAMYYLQKDIRMAGYNPTKSTTFFGFTDISSPVLVKFTWDGDENGVLANIENITYQRNGYYLQKVLGVAPATTTTLNIAENIAGLDFRFLDEDGNVTTDGTQVRSVEIILSASDGEHNRQLTARIRCRNMGI
jgi:type IV pilus assembly protein PilW